MGRGIGLGALGAVLCSLFVGACSGEATTAASDANGAADATTGAGAAASDDDSVGGASVTSGGQGGEGQGGGATVGQGGGSSGSPTASECFADAFVNPPMLGPDYDQFSPVVGSHCMGTNHQDISGVERVVFLGDSVTVGTPPTESGDYYRSLLAAELADKFGLAGAAFTWEMVNVFDGTVLTKESGDFVSCSKWGARADDLLTGGEQISKCFSGGDFDKKTLVVMTVGGNDINSLTQNAIDGVSEEQLWAQTEEFVGLMREAVEWIYEPGRFPNGVHVVFSNMYEFTDGTGEVESCDVSGLAGFDEPVPSPELLADMVIWANEQFIKIAVDTGADAIFMLEDFCGHGFNADDPTAPCYRGAGSEIWFDLTCIHPNPAGHQHIADMFMAVIDE